MYISATYVASIRPCSGGFACADLLFVFMVSLYVSGSICMNPRGYQKKVIKQSSLSLPKADKIPEIIDIMVSNSTSTTTSRRKIQD